MKGVNLFGVSGAVRVLSVAVLATTAVGCTASTGGDGGGSAASCTYRVEYAGRTYLGSEAKGFVLGARLGAATVPACDDTPGHGDDSKRATSATAYAIKGVDPGVAIALKDAGDDVIFVDVTSGTTLPEIKKLIRGS
ncbi:DUF6281 family protein [Streptomyces aureus]|uniref:DUF6281 family protein n=1 Tax=Streptomyces aureus TaxID=193461 RepID=UPI0033E09F23